MLDSTTVEGSLPWIVFNISALAVGLAGWQLAREGDEISSQTGLGGLWVGVILVGAATSLPEIVTNVTAAAIKEPDLAAGGLFGSNMANMAILALIDLGHRNRRVLRNVSQGQGLVAMLAITLTALAAAFIVVENRVEWWHVSPETFVLAAVYLAGTRIVIVQEYLAALARIAEKTIHRDDDEADAPPAAGLQLPRRKTMLLFGLWAIVILIFSPLLATAADDISNQTGLDATFVGVLFLATSTSLPELISGISAVRLGAYDLAVGNLFGSNCFNMFAFVFVDIAYRPGPVFAAVSPAEVVAALVAIVLMATAMMGVVYQSERRYFFGEPDALAVLIGYVVGLALVYDATA